MNIQINQSILEKFPNVKIGVLIGKNVNNKVPTAKISELMRQAEQKLRATYTTEDITSIPKIADWRDAYRAFGCKPSKHRCSVEALLRRVLQGKKLPTINPLVDIYNLVSIKHLLPAGGGNLDKIEGNINLTTAQGTEQFTMLGTTEPTTIAAGEVIYSDDKDVLCRAWNYRESDKTKIMPDIKNVYLLLEGLQHTSDEELQSALTELEELVASHCSGEFKTFVLSTENPKISV